MKTKRYFSAFVVVVMVLTMVSGSLPALAQDVEHVDFHVSEFVLGVEEEHLPWASALEEYRYVELSIFIPDGDDDRYLLDEEDDFMYHEMLENIFIPFDSLMLDVGGIIEIPVEVLPLGSSQDVIWSSSDESIATVYPDGTVTAISEGVAILTITALGGELETIVEVTVIPEIMEEGLVVPFTSAPGPPSSVAAQATSSTGAILTWLPPTSTGGSQIIGYDVRVGTGSWVRLAANARSRTFTGLTPGSTVNLQVRAVNRDFGAGFAANRSVTLTVQRSLTFNAGTGATWSSVPAGWTRNASQTQLSRTVNSGTAWSNITWPTAANLSRANHAPSIPARPTGNVPASGGTVSWTVTWTQTVTPRTLTFNAGTGATWSSVPAGWTRNASQTQLTRTANSGTAWSNITWPTAANLSRANHTPSIPARPTGNVPATGGVTSWTVTWAPVQHRVDFNFNQGTRTGGGAQSQWVSHGGAATAPIVVRTGHTFSGWSRALTNITAPVTITAMWTINRHTVNFSIPNDATRTGGGALSQTVNHGNHATLPIVSRPGFTFAGWNPENAHNNVTNSRTITAQWTQNAPAAPSQPWASNVATASFNVNWNSVANAANYRLDVSTNSNFTNLVINNRLVVNATFSPVSGLNANTTYWFRVRAVNSSGQTSGNSVAGTTTTLPNTFTVTLARNGGTGGATSHSVTLNSVPAQITNRPTNPGHTLTGFWTMPSGGTRVFDGNGHALTSVTGFTNASRQWTRTAGVELHAQWTPITYTVNLDRNGGTAGATSFTVPFGSNVMTGYSNPTRAGHTFNGYWTAATGGSQVISPAGALVANVPNFTNASRQWIRTATPTTLHARWTQNALTAPQNVAIINPTSNSVTVTWTPVPGATGYRVHFGVAPGGFAFDEALGEFVYDISLENTALDEVEYFVYDDIGEFDFDGMSEDVAYDELEEFMLDDLQEDFVYDNLGVSAFYAALEEFDFDEALEEFTADWLEDNFESFSVGLPYRRVAGANSSSITLTGLLHSQVSNIVFVVAEGAGTESLPSNSVPHLFFTVTYTGNGMTGGSIPFWHNDGRDGAAYSLNDWVYVQGNPGNLSRTDHVFAGWSTSPTAPGTIFLRPENHATGHHRTRIAGNITLFARWTPVQHQVTFNIYMGGGNTQVITRSINHNTRLDSNMPTPTRNGFTPRGWFTAEHGGEQRLGSFLVTEDLDLHMRWTLLYRNYGLLGWHYPLNAGAGFRHIVSGFNPDRQPRPHIGIDIRHINDPVGALPGNTTALVYNQPVQAAHTGIVLIETYHHETGNYVVIRSNISDGTSGRYLTSRYLHLRFRSPVSMNRPVSQGDLIGNVGYSGYYPDPDDPRGGVTSRGGHLHLDFNNRGLTGGTQNIIDHDAHINPQLFFNINFVGDVR